MSILESQKKILLQNKIFREGLPKDKVLRLMREYWHILAFFPEFLRRVVAISPELEMKARIAFILNQELGNGRYENSHEFFYLELCKDLGLDPEKIKEGKPNSVTSNLINGYRTSLNSFEAALGVLVSTERSDLEIVSVISSQVEQAFGIGNSKWEKIHVYQEPEHVDFSSSALDLTLSLGMSQATIQSSADSNWRLWDGFFEKIFEEEVR